MRPGLQGVLGTGWAAGAGYEKIASAVRYRAVKLPAAVKGVMYCTIALARPGERAVLFSEDLYRLDVRLEAAWARSR